MIYERQNCLSRLQRRTLRTAPGGLISESGVVFVLVSEDDDGAKIVVAQRAQREDGLAILQLWSHASAKNVMEKTM